MTDPNEDQLTEALLDVSSASGSGSDSTRRMELQDPAFISSPWPIGIQDTKSVTPMSDRVDMWTSSSLPLVQPQQHSLLFSLPSELRERIWFYALTQDAKPLTNREPHQFNYRPDHDDDPREEDHRELLRYNLEHPPSELIPHILPPPPTTQVLDGYPNRVFPGGCRPWIPDVSLLNPTYPSPSLAWNTATYDWYRPGYEGFRYTPGLSLLRTCRKVYLEASPLVAKAKTFTFWYFRAPPGQSTVSQQYFNTVIPVDQRQRATDVRLFVQQYWLEQSFFELTKQGGLEPPAWQVPQNSSSSSNCSLHSPSINGNGNGGSEHDGERSEKGEAHASNEEEDDDDKPPSLYTPSSPSSTHSPVASIPELGRQPTDQGFFRHLTRLRLTIRRGDWWNNENNQLPVTNPFSGASRSSAKTTTTTLQTPPGASGTVAAVGAMAAEEGADKNPLLIYTAKDEQSFAPGSWGLAFKNLPHLRTIVLDLEHSEDHAFELARIASWVRQCWWFPAADLYSSSPLVKGGGDKTAATAKVTKRRFQFIGDEKARGMGVDHMWSWRGDCNQWSHVCTGDGCNHQRHAGPGRVGTHCSGGWCQRKRKMLSMELGPRIYGYSFVFERRLVDG